MAQRPYEGGLTTGDGALIRMHLDEGCGMQRAMRLALIATLLLTSGVATADVGPGYKLVEDGALGIPLPSDHDLLTTAPAGAGVARCLGKTPAKGSALVWLELGKRGAVTAARVHGTGVTALDACIASALQKAAAGEPLPGPIVIVGHLDLLEAAKQDSNAYFESPRISTVAVVVAPLGGVWQLGAKRIGYTANRAADIAQALDAQAPAIAACAAGRRAKLATANLLAWTDGTAVVRGSGDARYDGCLAKALRSIKLPAPESALWMELELREAGEPLAPMGTTHDKAVREGLRDAAKTRKAALDVCFNNKPNAKLGKITLVLKDEKVTVKKIATGDPGVDACVKQRLETIAVKPATAGDTAEIDIVFD